MKMLFMVPHKDVPRYAVSDSLLHSRWHIFQARPLRFSKPQRSSKCQLDRKTELFVGKGRLQVGFGDKLVGYMHLAGKFPDAALAADSLKLKAELVAGNDRLAETGIVDTHKIGYL